MPPAPKKPKQRPLQLAASMPTPATLEDALEIIDTFKAEQAELVKHIAKTDPSPGDAWDWEKDLKYLEDEAKSRKGFGIEPWFPKSIAALSGRSAGNTRFR
jgi:hypothetical protein